MNTMHLPLLRRSGVALAAALLILAGCAGEEQPEAEPPTTAAAESTAQGRSIRVETLVLQPQPFEDIVEVTGTVEALDDATLSAQASGTITQLVSLGQQVGAGTAVAQIDATVAQAAVGQAQATVEAAEAQLELAEDNFQRQEPLYRDSVISALEFENVRAQRNSARAQLAQAEAALAQAQKQLQNTRVVTPFAGTVEERFVERGEQVSPGTPIARVVNTGRVKVTAGVPERYASDIQEGAAVQVDFRAYGGSAQQGRVTFVGKAINPDNRTFPVEIELPNPDGRLKPEMVAKVYVPREQIADALVVPQTAILRDEEGQQVYVAVRQGDTAVAERRDVVLGASYGGRAVVLSGLQPGDEVIVLGQTAVAPGDRLDVTERREELALN